MLDSLPWAGTKCSASAWHIDWCTLANDDLNIGDMVTAAGAAAAGDCKRNDDANAAAAWAVASADADNGGAGDDGDADDSLAATENR